MDAAVLRLEARILGLEMEDEADEEADVALSEWELFLNLRRNKDRGDAETIKRLKSMNAPAEITATAIEYFKTTISSPVMERHKLKAAVMAVAAVMAHAIHGSAIDETTVCEVFKVNKKKYSKAMKFVKIAVMETRGINDTKDSGVMQICKSLGIQASFDEIRQFIKNQPRNGQLCHHYSSVYSWLIINKQRIPDITSFSRMCDLSPKSLKRTSKLNSSALDAFLKSRISEMTRDFVEKVESTYSVTLPPPPPFRVETVSASFF